MNPENDTLWPKLPQRNTDRPDTKRRSPHSLHIPVMGTGFTIDTPLKVARFGISSVVSLGDDHLIEQMRQVYAGRESERFVPIGPSEPDARVRRIRAYLNLLNDLVIEQVNDVRRGSFEQEGDLMRYFRMLPSGPLREKYLRMQNCTEPTEKLALQESLRREVNPGRIDVNIMTKIDSTQYRNDRGGAPETGVAMSALRGFATSDLNSRVVLSAGINKRLFGYIATFDDFIPCAGKPPRKGVTLKVSDFRSAQLQGRLLARKGIWVSEFRVESGLNCGGHAFATLGELMGPILDEFCTRKSKLHSELLDIYARSLRKINRTPWGGEAIELTAQGGVGTREEQALLTDLYELESIGWGTPFLLVPEVTNVDRRHLEKLAAAREVDVCLSDASPLGVPFWKLMTSESDDVRRAQIADNRPGSSCPKRFLISNTEFTEHPICPASRNYQARKISQLLATMKPGKVRDESIRAVTAKSCLCSDLAASAQLKNNLDSTGHTAICCGPGIANFDRVLLLEELLDHIYGRKAVGEFEDRPHVFLKELSLYIDYLKDQIALLTQDISDSSARYLTDFRNNLIQGIEYYRNVAADWSERFDSSFTIALTQYEKQLKGLLNEYLPVFQEESPERLAEEAG